MFVQLFIFIIIAYAISDYLKKRQRNELLEKANVPGRFPLPILGNALELRNISNENVFEFWKKNLSNKDKIYRFWNLSRLIILCANARDVEALCSSNVLIQKTFVNDMMKAWLGDGLLMSIGKKWHQRRKIITPTFHFKILEQFVEVFDQQGDVLVEKLSQHADGKTVDIFGYICLAALDIITASAMGVTVGAQKNDQFGYTKAVRETSDIFALRGKSPLLISNFFFRLLQPNNHKLLADNINLMQTFTKSIIAKRRNIIQNSAASNKDNNQKENDDESFGTKKRAAFLDVLLQATVDGQPLSDEDIREEVETFMFEGHDTTTSGVSFTLYLISRYPEVQKRIFSEIRDVIGDDKKRPVALRDLQELKYLELVIKESLRIFPPVPVIGRHIPEDSELNGKTLPGQSYFVVPVYIMCHDPDYFKDPEKFDPERFSADNISQVDPFSYIPFSAGSRNCIGQKFAMLEMKSTLSKILRHYELLPVGEAPILQSAIVLRSTNGVQLGLRPRVYE